MSRLPAPLVVHGSAVARQGRGVLILGRSGSGKSGLALRLIALGAALVADDRVLLTRRDDDLVATAPASIAGLIEGRGVGLLRADAVPEARLALAVDLDRPAAARMPQPDAITLLGVRLDLISGQDVPNIDAVLTILLNNGRARTE